MGHRLVERLQAEGYQVLVLTRDATKAQVCFPRGAVPSRGNSALHPHRLGGLAAGSLWV
ncbi:hypothetical protein [Neosynechococcus sphagnicola]|uniref:hypothetical protein n=1 Tax=Neosynechococcus sphagnicola TaxID=1501145 RepID=UPI0030846716